MGVVGLLVYVRAVAWLGALGWAGDHGEATRWYKCLLAVRTIPHVLCWWTKWSRQHNSPPTLPHGPRRRRRGLCGRLRSPQIAWLGSSMAVKYLSSHHEWHHAARSDNRAHSDNRASVVTSIRCVWSCHRTTDGLQFGASGHAIGQPMAWPACWMLHAILMPACDKTSARVLGLSG